MPFVVITVRARLAGFDRSIEEAARDLGANELRISKAMANTSSGITMGI